MLRFLTQHPAGRKLVILTHGRLFHRGLKRPLTFGWGCWLCEWVTRDFSRRFPPEPFLDESRVELGKIGDKTIVTNATVIRKLELLEAENPEVAAAVRRQIEDIARNPDPMKDPE